MTTNAAKQRAGTAKQRHAAVARCDATAARHRAAAEAQRQRRQRNCSDSDSDSAALSDEASYGERDEEPTARASMFIAVSVWPIHTAVAYARPLHPQQPLCTIWEVLVRVRVLILGELLKVPVRGRAVEYLIAPKRRTRISLY